MDVVTVTRRDKVLDVQINRPRVRNAVNAATAQALYSVFLEFEQDTALAAAVLSGEGEHFCAGADLKAIARGELNPLEPDGCAPMGPTRLQLSKPVVAAIEGYAVAGGLELALWCDLRVASRAAIFGVFSRRVGVPLIDLGTVRLPRLIGMSRALDMVLTGRAVSAEEAHAWGLVNYLTEPGGAREAALALARDFAEFPQTCLRADRASVYAGQDLPRAEAALSEFRSGLRVIASGETARGAKKFAGIE